MFCTLLFLNQAYLFDDDHETIRMQEQHFGVSKFMIKMSFDEKVFSFLVVVEAKKY